MQLYCKTVGGVLTVIASHADGDGTLPSAYGDGVIALPYSGDTALEDLLGKPLPEGMIDLAGYAKAARDRHEENGISVSGVPIATDDRSKTLVLGARRRVEKDPSLVTKWSAADGAVYPLDASTVIAISDAIGDFVAELFEAYAGIMADLAAGKITTPGEIDARYGALDVAF